MYTQKDSHDATFSGQASARCSLLGARGWVVQGAGTALRINAADFRRELQECPELLRILNRYLYVLMAQLSQTAPAPTAMKSNRAWRAGC